MKKLIIILTCLLLAGCVSIKLPDGTEYFRFGPQQIDDCLITRPDGTEILFEGQKSELPTVTITLPVGAFKIGGDEVKP